MDKTIERWLTDLQSGVESAATSEEFREWLAFQSRFHDYSFQNSLLIHAQCPDATKVAGYRTWQTEFDRQVSEGERAIWIRAPIVARQCPQCGKSQKYCQQSDCESDETPLEEWSKGVVGFRPVAVFDISQTEGEPIPDLETEVYGEANSLLSTLLSIAPSLEVSVEVIPSAEWTHGSAEGICTYYPESREYKAEIEIRHHPNTAMVAHTLVHEYAHALLHGTGDDDRSAREVEAESVAYLVSRAFGLDAENASFYLVAWRDDESSVLRDRLTRISRTAATVIETAKQRHS